MAVALWVWEWPWDGTIHKAYKAVGISLGYQTPVPGYVVSNIYGLPSLA